MRFRHYKGGFYELVALAKEEANPENLLVIYRAEIDGTVWARPVSVFFERVESQSILTEAAQTFSRPPRVSRFTVLEPSKEQVFCCDSGCETVVPYPRLFEFSREISTDGVLISSKTKPYWACHHCGEDVRVFDTITNDVTDLPENE